MSSLRAITRNTIALALDHHHAEPLIGWIRTLATGLGYEDQATDMPSPPFRAWLRSWAAAPLPGITTRALLEGLSLPALAAISLTLASALDPEPPRHGEPSPVMVGHHPGHR
jgi:hypothetical protein